jgi:hypothetical protein
MDNMIHIKNNPGECLRIHRGLTNNINFEGINAMADSECIKSGGEIKNYRSVYVQAFNEGLRPNPKATHPPGRFSEIENKFCVVCGKKRPHNHLYFHSRNGKTSYVCLNCQKETSHEYCVSCGKKTKTSSNLCVSCGRVKRETGRFFSKQNPQYLADMINKYMGKAKTPDCPISIICNTCGFILPLHEYYFQRQRNRRHGFEKKCKRCKVGRLGVLPPPMTNAEKAKARAKYKRGKTDYKHWGKKLFANETRKGEKGKLQAKCRYCGQWFYPTVGAVESRARACIGQLNANNELYCSQGCKSACPSFKQKWSEKKYKQGTSREANTVLRQMVLERDGYKCTKCGAKGKKVQLHCHHVMPARQNPMLANDPDTCVCLCKACHVDIHRQAGCGYYELRCGAA